MVLHYLKKGIMSFLNLLFFISKSSSFLHVFFTYDFQIVLCPGGNTLPMVPFGHIFVTVATTTEHILHTPFHSAREQWAVTIELPLKCLGHAEPRGRSLCYRLDLSLSRLLSQIISSVAYLKYGEIIQHLTELLSSIK